MSKILLVDESVSGGQCPAGFLSRNGGAGVIRVDGHEALSAIEGRPPALVLIALPDVGTNLPAVLRDVHFRYPSLPIILMAPQAITPKLIDALQQQSVVLAEWGHNLAWTLDQLLTLSLKEQSQPLVGYVCRTESSFSLENDPALIDPLVALLQQTAARCEGMDENIRTQLGVALHEGLLNAIYHGNLEVSSELREVGETAFLALANQRRCSSPHRDRRVHVKATMSSSKIVFVIRDEGPGFDPKAIPNPTDPDNLSRASGRGILLMRTFVDHLYYSATGNELTLVKRLPANGDGA